jgi:crotonobetainyl-CoA:carnitine CoA-transferase CaiB-like acyl-CoA transferase
VLERPQWAQAPAWRDNAGRVRDRARLVPQLAEAIAAWPRAALLAALEVQGVPAGPINDLAEVFADPQVRHRGLRLDLPAPGLAGGRVPGLRTPIRFSDATLAPARAAPALGAHTDAVRAELETGAP